MIQKRQQIIIKPITNGLLIKWTVHTRYIGTLCNDEHVENYMVFGIRKGKLAVLQNSNKMKKKQHFAVEGF